MKAFESIVATGILLGRHPKGCDCDECVPAIDGPEDQAYDRDRDARIGVR